MGKRIGAGGRDLGCRSAYDKRGWSELINSPRGSSIPGLCKTMPSALPSATMPPCHDGPLSHPSLAQRVPGCRSRASIGSRLQVRSGEDDCVIGQRRRWRVVLQPPGCGTCFLDGERVVQRIRIRSGWTLFARISATSQVQFLRWQALLTCAATIASSAPQPDRCGAMKG